MKGHYLVYGLRLHAPCSNMKGRYLVYVRLSDCPLNDVVAFVRGIIRAQ